MRKFKIRHYKNGYRNQYCEVFYKPRWSPFWIACKDPDKFVLSRKKFQWRGEALEYIEKLKATCPGYKTYEEEIV